MNRTSTSSIFAIIFLLVISDNRGAIALPYLSADYYEKTCPSMEKIVLDTVINKQFASPTTAGGALRLFFHDCFVDGCDASVLISSTPFLKAERDADINLSLPGDAFDVIIRAKTTIELACPGIVSCSDILTVAVRDLVKMVGGPFYSVRFGRKDSLSSSASLADAILPTSSTSIPRIIARFRRSGFTIRELVALTGAHTIGFSHCKEFASRIYNYTGAAFDPSLNPRFAKELQSACSTYRKDPTMSVFNDVMTPGKFDNSYFQNLPRGLGLLSTDAGLYSNKRTRPFVELYARNETAFFDDFARAMEKLSLYKVKTGESGEIRNRCDAFNLSP